MVTQENHDSVRWTIWEYKRVRPLVVANRKWNGTNSNSLGASGLNWLVTWPLKKKSDIYFGRSLWMSSVDFSGSKLYIYTRQLPMSMHGLIVIFEFDKCQILLHVYSFIMLLIGMIIMLKYRQNENIKYNMNMILISCNCRQFRMVLL